MQMKFKPSKRERINGGYRITAEASARCQRIKTKFHTGIKTRWEDASMHNLVIEIKRLTETTWRAKAHIVDYEGIKTPASLATVIGPLALLRGFETYVGTKDGSWKVAGR